MDLEKLGRITKRYVKKYPDYKEAILLYSSVVEVQKGIIGEISPNDDRIYQGAEDKLSKGEPIFNPFQLEIDISKFRKALYEICKAVDLRKSGGYSHADELLDWDGTKEDGFEVARSKVILGDKLEIGKDWPDEDRELTSSIFWESLVPFYMNFRRAYEASVEGVQWQRGYCPVCGCRPLMGFFRQEDGLWLLECSLCRSQWSVKRAECPFCDGKGESGLNYAYAEQHPNRRLQYCESCKRFLKTVDLRDSNEDIFLPFEDIVTDYLDEVAREYGLSFPECYFVERESEHLCD